MPAAAIGPIIGGVAALASTGIAAATNKTPKPPDISDERKKTLGRFAEMMSKEDENLKRDDGSIVLRPGGRPIYFPISSNPYKPKDFTNIG